MTTRTRGRMCAGKTGYPNRGAALAQLERFVALGTDRAGLSVYDCRFCPSWHVGHIRPSLRRRAS